jgi:hypothetical protein
MSSCGLRLSRSGRPLLCQEVDALSMTMVFQARARKAQANVFIELFLTWVSLGRTSIQMKYGTCGADQKAEKLQLKITGNCGLQRWRLGREIGTSERMQKSSPGGGLRSLDVEAHTATRSPESTSNWILKRAAVVPRVQRERIECGRKF